MKSDKKVKRNTKLIILSVLVLTIVSLSYSYSAFFSIEAKSTVHAISTGTLDVTASASPMAKTEVFPTEETLPTKPESTLNNEGKDCATLTVNNNGNIDANFIVSISYDEDSIPQDSKEVGLVSFENLIVGIYEDGTGWLNLNPDEEGEPIYNMQITQFATSEPDVYPIFKGSIAKATMNESKTTPTTRNLRVYVWLADTTPTSEIGKLMYLKLNVQSMPAEGQEEKQVQIKSKD